MQFIAQYQDSKDIGLSDFQFQLTRLWPVISVLASKDPRLAEWFLQGANEKDAQLYPVYDAKATPSAAATAVLKEQYRNEKALAKTIGMWNGQTVKKDGASIVVTFDTAPMPADIDISIGEESATSSRLGEFDAIAQIVAAVAHAYAPAYVTAAPRKYMAKQVFDDKPGVGWMLYLPKVVTAQQIPEARALIPVYAAGNRQAGTIIVSVTDAVFSLANPEHVEIANRIEVRLVDQDLLPRYSDIPGSHG